MAGLASKIQTVVISERRVVKMRLFRRSVLESCIFSDVSNVDLEETDFSGFNNTSPTPKLAKPKKVPDSPDSDSSDIQKALKKANEERDAILQHLIQPIKNRGICAGKCRGEGLICFFPGPAQASQRYSSDDLYKPRPLFPGTRRTRGIANNAG